MPSRLHAFHETPAREENELIADQEIDQRAETNGYEICQDRIETHSSRKDAHQNQISGDRDHAGRQVEAQEKRSPDRTRRAALGNSRVGGTQCAGSRSNDGSAGRDKHDCRSTFGVSHTPGDRQAHKGAPTETNQRILDPSARSARDDANDVLAGFFVECESISLRRSIPFGLGWLMEGYVESIPRESLENTLTSIRDGVKAPVSP